MFQFLAQSAQLTREDVIQIVEATQSTSVTEIASQMVVIVVGIIGLPAFMMFIWYVVKRMNSGEVRFTKIEGDITSIKDDVRKSEDVYVRAINAIDNMNKRLGNQQVMMAETRKDVKHISERMEEFFGDSKPGRGITSKIKQAVRETMKHDVLSKPEATLYPDADFTEVDFERSAASVSLYSRAGRGAEAETAELRPEQELKEDADTDKVSPPKNVKPLMRPQERHRSNPLLNPQRKRQS